MPPAASFPPTGETAFLHNKHFVSLSLISTLRGKKNNTRVNQEQSLFPCWFQLILQPLTFQPLLTASPAVAMVACRSLLPLPEGSDHPASAAACHVALLAGASTLCTSGEKMSTTLMD